MRSDILCSVAILVCLSGCTVGTKMGNEFNDHAVKNIRVGKTTKAEIIQMFGQPPSRNSVGGGVEGWVYVYSENSGKPNAVMYVPIVGMFAGEVTTKFNNKTLSIQFTGDIVSGCTFSKISSGETVKVLGSNDFNQPNSITVPCEEVM